MEVRRSAQFHFLVRNFGRARCRADGLAGTIRGFDCARILPRNIETNSRDANNFTFTPLKEIGWLFLGIFGTMIPVLEFMEHSAGRLGLNSDLTFYWATGMLSALLDTRRRIWPSSRPLLGFMAWTSTNRRTLPGSSARIAAS